MHRVLINTLAIVVLCPQVIFEGITGTSYTGDIAIDDVEMIDGACPLPGRPMNLLPIMLEVAHTCVSEILPLASIGPF